MARNKMRNNKINKAGHNARHPIAVVKQKCFINPQNKVSFRQPTKSQRLRCLLRFPYIALTAIDEFKCMKIAYIHFYLKNKVLLTLHRFLCTKLLASIVEKDIDFKVLLRIAKKENLVDPNGFMPNMISAADVDEAISTRNETDHLQLNSIDQNWRTRTSSYAILCDSFNDKQMAKDIRTASAIMQAGNFSGIVDFSFRFSSTFSHAQAFGVSQIVYGILLRYLANVVRKFLIGKLGLQNVTLDLDANLKYIKNALLTNPDFIKVGGYLRGDAGLFNTVYRTRLCYAHGWFVMACNDWQLQLQSIIDILKLLKAPTEANEVQRILDKLVRFKNGGVLLTSQEFDIMG